MARRGFEIEPMQWLERLALAASYQATLRQLNAGVCLSVADVHDLIHAKLAGKAERAEPGEITASRVARVVFAKRHSKEHHVDAMLAEVRGLTSSPHLLSALGPIGPRLISQRCTAILKMVDVEIAGLDRSTPHLADRLRAMVLMVIDASTSTEVRDLLRLQYLTPGIASTCPDEPQS